MPCKPFLLTCCAVLAPGAPTSGVCPIPSRATGDSKLMEQRLLAGDDVDATVGMVNQCKGEVSGVSEPHTDDGHTAC